MIVFGELVKNYHPKGAGYIVLYGKTMYNV